LPALTRFYGLRPVDIEAMTFGEVAEYRRQLAEYQQRQAEAREGR